MELASEADLGAAELAAQGWRSNGAHGGGAQGRKERRRRGPA
jgi:hypothetical protein